ncbi:tetratricopeptide repeat protein [Candidatus Uabimicrobium amorphum]|uniref:Tetratricopeptide repeat protein n=1 Tax=Uabimicrobium amorphum TaxID=2596890 RepID=A0A5S9IHS3_UABAM|nr:hypothetical protein UABAM_00055 [Candidatus Uabimicrobium amorphum]
MKNSKKKKSELVRLLCWSCGKRVKVPIKFAGKTGTCPKCKAKIQIPSLKTIKSTIKELESQQQKETQQALDNIDFPSLPSLKTIVLEDTDPQSPGGKQSSFSVKPPAGAEGTAEMLMNSGSSEMSDFDISGDFSDNLSGEDIEAPAFEDLGKVAVPPTRNVTPDDQFITSADEQFYNELASNSGVEKTETWAESQDIKAVDTNSDIFHTPSSYDSGEDISIGDEQDAFDQSSFAAEPLDNDFIFGDNDDPLALDNDLDEGLNADFAEADDMNADFAAPVEAGAIEDNDAFSFDAQPLDGGGEDFVPADDLVAAEEFVPADAVVPEAVPEAVVPEAVVPEAIPEAVVPEAVVPEAFPEEALTADTLEDDGEDFDVESVTGIEEVDIDDVEEIEDDLEEDISSVEDAIDEASLGEDFQIEGSEVVQDDDGVADAVFINEGEKSEVELSDEGFAIDYTRIAEEENFMGSNADVQAGWQFFQQKKWEHALYHYSKAIVENNDAASAYYARALLHACEQNWQKSLTDIREAKKLGYHKADVENRYNQIVFHKAKEYWEKGAFARALKVLDLMETKASQILKGKVYWKRAQFLMEKGADKQVLSDLDDAIFNNYVKPELFVMRGRIYFSLSDYESAVYDFTAAINRGEKNACVLRARSEAYYYLKKYDDALQDVSDAIVLDSENASLHNLKGLLLTQKGDFPASEQAFEESVALDPNNSNFYFNRGLAYIIQKRYDRAIDDFTKVIQFSEDKVAYFKRAICYQEKPNPNLIQAREDFKTADNMGVDSMYRTDLFRK